MDWPSLIVFVCIIQRVTTAQGKALADEFGINFFETSAKLDTNVDNAFMSISKDIVYRLKVNPEHYGGGDAVKVKDEKKSKGGCC